ncbi:hypothetical protein FQN54_001769 [Arachnomyces sp. PD_36]|nr:hypothetical protein FQN54_001769 [Arachnomyces sp. PD_36]
MAESHITPLYYPLDYIFGFDMDIIIKFNPSDYQVRHHGPFDIRTERYSPRHTVPKQIVRVLREHDVEVDTSGYFSRKDVDISANCWAIAEGPFSALIDYEGEGSSDRSFCAVKIVSPVFRYTYESFFQVDRILKIIRENFEVDVSSACDLNVHIGATFPVETVSGESFESKGFPLQTVRNLLQLVSLFRPQLSNIHPPCRVSSKERQFPKDFFLRTMDPLDAVAAIESCDSISDIFKLWEHSPPPTKASCGGRWVNPLCQISNLLSRSETNSTDQPTRTLLFRQHHATLDFERVYHWIRLLVDTVRFSHECGPGGLPLSLLLEADYGHTGGFDTIAFMNAIGSKASAKFYQDRLYAHESAVYLDDDPGDEDKNNIHDSWVYLDSTPTSPDTTTSDEEWEIIPTSPPSTSPTSPYPTSGSGASTPSLPSSISAHMGSPIFPAYPPTGIDTANGNSNSTWEPISSALLNQYLLSTLPQQTNEWSHIVDVLTSLSLEPDDGGDGDADNDYEGYRDVFGSCSSCRGGGEEEMGDISRIRIPSDFWEENEGVRCDLTHRKVQY